MKSPRRAFTAELDALVLEQIEQRAKVNGRSRSQETSHLARIAMDLLEHGTIREQTGPINVPRKICIYIPVELRQRIQVRADNNERSAGAQLNIVLRTALEYQTSTDAQLLNGVRGSRSA